MKQLGLLEPEQEPEDEVAEVKPEVKKASRKALSDDELLSQFEDLDLDNFKG